MDDTLLLSIFVGVEGAHAFSAFMPSYFTVKKFAAEQSDKQALRSGYTPAILFNLILGGAVSGLTRDLKPFVIALVVIAFMLLMYEGAIGEVGR